MPQAWKVRQNITNASRQSVEALANLELHDDVSKPVPGSKAALIRIRAVSLNARDLLVLTSSSLYPVPTFAGLVPCCDAAGVVEEVGTGSAWKAGHRVIVHPNTWVSGRDQRDFDITRVFGGAVEGGALAEYMVVGDERLIRVPEHLSFEEASALPTAGGTACYSLFFVPEQPIGKGSSVLVQGTGGVSTSAIQLAAAAGAVVIATSGSDEKRVIAKQLGARHTINYRHAPRWDEEMTKITHGQGVDFALDVGGAGTIEQSLRAVRQGGLVSVAGILTPAKEIDIVPAILYGAKTGESGGVGTMTTAALVPADILRLVVRGQLGVSKTMVEELVRRMDADKIHPVIARTFEWHEAKEAFEMLMNQSAIGKIIIKGVPVRPA